MLCVIKLRLFSFDILMHLCDGDNNVNLLNFPLQVFNPICFSNRIGTNIYPTTKCNNNDVSGSSHELHTFIPHCYIKSSITNYIMVLIILTT